MIKIIDNQVVNHQGKWNYLFYSILTFSLRLSLRGDRNEINDVEEGTIKRTTTRKPTTTSLLRTTFRTYTAPPLKKSLPN